MADMWAPTLPILVVVAFGATWVFLYVASPVLTAFMPLKNEIILTDDGSIDLWSLVTKSLLVLAIGLGVGLTALVAHGQIDQRARDQSFVESIRDRMAARHLICEKNAEVCAEIRLSRVAAQQICMNRSARSAACKAARDQVISKTKELDSLGLPHGPFVEAKYRLPPERG